MKKKILTIEIPEGYDDAELVNNKIVFKKKQPIPWRETEHTISGFYVADNSDIRPLGCICDNSVNKNLFATEKQAKSMLAMAQLSQIIANDERFGGPIPDKKWPLCTIKYVITRVGNSLQLNQTVGVYSFLAFHTREQAAHFLVENEDLIKQYYMLD